ncbi:MAG: hypothetical protein KGD63_03595 [Candidatus Lokiarchaeota archaeon]|nr:hypothetical protein [Candidatus Lokiarchaeota archaeon]
MNNKPDLNIDNEIYKYGIHPLFKLMGLILLNIIAFTDFFEFIKLYIFVIELLLAILVKVSFRKIKGFTKILLLNFIGLYFLFYFVNFDLINAFFLFIDYSIMILIMVFATFIFYEITPPYELLLALKKLKISTKFAIAITISLSFFPIINDRMKKILAFQRSRGYKLRLWRLGPILIPIFLTILDLSINLSISLDGRGYRLN